MVKVVINGFGRIGRAAFKIAFERRDVEIVAINDPNDIEALAQLLQFDSSYVFIIVKLLMIRII